MSDSAECFIYKGSNFKMWKKLLINILKAKELSDYITTTVFNDANREGDNFKEIELDCKADLDSDVPVIADVAFVIGILPLGEADRIRSIADSIR